MTKKKNENSGAFTLVELLVAMAILAIMLGSLAVLMNSTLLATVNGGKHLDADTEARVALDRIAYDISQIVKRPDIDYYFVKGTPATSDQMAFYSQAGGYFPTATTPAQGSPISLVGYRVNSGLQLERLSKGLVWNGVSSGMPMVFLPNLLTTSWTGIAGTAIGSNADYHVIGDMIFRLEVCYLVQDATTNACLSDTPYITPSTGLIVPTGTTTQAAEDALIAQDLVAIVVTIGVLDAESQKLSTGKLQTAAQKLTHITGTAQSGGSGAITPTALAASVWLNEIIAAGGLGLPVAANSQVRVYQRYCYVNRLENNL